MVGRSMRILDCNGRWWIVRQRRVLLKKMVQMAVVMRILSESLDRLMDVLMVDSVVNERSVDSLHHLVTYLPRMALLRQNENHKDKELKHESIK